MYGVIPLHTRRITISIPMIIHVVLLFNIRNHFNLYINIVLNRIDISILLQLIECNVWLKKTINKMIPGYTY
ncbi:unnamed protein product [Rotaria socialis]